jgi:hypothetical protein
LFITTRDFKESGTEEGVNEDNKMRNIFDCMLDDNRWELKVVRLLELGENTLQ